MIKVLALFLVASLLALALALAPAAARPPDRVECDRPTALRLHRFEDGSARLECGPRILVRVSVPG